MTSEIALTHVSTPLAPLVTVFHFIRTHPCSGNIFEVAQLLSWMVISSGDWLLSALGLWVLGLRVEDVRVWGSWFDNIFFLAQLSKFKLIPISEAKELVPACLYPLHHHYWSVSFFSLFSVCLPLSPHFLYVSISILIFCPSPSLSLFSACLHLYLETEKKWGLGLRQTENTDRDGDRRIIRI